ncbi:MAG: hypothetical protein HY203_08680 [Nitrospirae bacterium]|nr:hypothetical protein [Nitrospirota bacterium]
MQSKQNVSLIFLILMIFIGGCAHPIPPVKSEVQDDESRRESMVKEYLISKYKPGTCFGLPGPQDEISRHLIQFRETVLIKIDQGYRFIIKDGHCCTINNYQGKIIMDGDKIIEEKITNKSVEAVPC